MTGSAASAGRSMGGLFLEVYFKEVGGPGGGGGRCRTAIQAWRISKNRVFSLKFQSNIDVASKVL
mgnify:CR=1 FL=1